MVNLNHTKNLNNGKIGTSQTKRYEKHVYFFNITTGMAYAIEDRYIYILI